MDNTQKNDNEILIPTYVYEHFEKYGYKKQGSSVLKKDIKYDDLFGLEFSYSEKPYG